MTYLDISQLLIFGNVHMAEVLDLISLQTTLSIPWPEDLIFTLAREHNDTPVNTEEITQN